MSGVAVLLCLIPVIVLVVVQLRLGDSSAPPMFYFWLLLLITRLPLVIRFHNHLLGMFHPDEATVSISHFITFIVAIIGFVLEWFAIPGQQTGSPEDNCSHASILFYSWLDPLFWQGLKGTLSEDSVPELQSKFSVNSLVSE